MFKNLGIGIGLRATHFSEIESSPPKVDWFEIISENFMDTEGRPMRVLDSLAQTYGIVLHGVSGSLGSTDPISWDYWRRLKNLAGRCRAAWISDHLCWTGVLGQNTHDLLPLPYTEETLDHVCRRIRAVQDFLGHPLVLENPSSYLTFQHSTLSEWEFVRAMTDQSGCKLLLDVNNVIVSSVNHSFDPKIYIDAIDPGSVVQYHLAGHTDFGTHVLDTHVGPVPRTVWNLYDYAVGTLGERSTLLEWDDEIPSLAEVVAEAQKAQRFLRRPLQEERI